MLIRIFLIVLPFLLGIAYYGICWQILPEEPALLLGGLMIAYVIPPAGKESIIPIGVALGLPWWLIAISVALMDILAGLFMALNFDIALKIPVLGHWIAKFIRNGKFFLEEKPWLARLYFVGVVFFVMFPLQGSGGVGASLVGRILGLTRWAVLLAITIGALCGTFAIALASEYFRDVILENPLSGLLTLAAVIFVIVALYAAYRFRSR